MEADLLLRRRITLPMGETVVHVRDEVLNQGFENAGLMLLYHCNPGYPVVADGSVLITPPAEITPRDENAARGMDERTALHAGEYAAVDIGGILFLRQDDA